MVLMALADLHSILPREAHEHWRTSALFLFLFYTILPTPRHTPLFGKTHTTDTCLAHGQESGRAMVGRCSLSFGSLAPTPEQSHLYH